MSKTLVHVDGSGWNGRETKFCVAWGTAKGEWKHKVVRTTEEFTNNEMEYKAVIYAMGNFKRAAVFTDSELVVRQIEGLYKVREERLRPLCVKAKELMKRNENSLAWVPRDENKAGVILEKGV